MGRFEDWWLNRAVPADGWHMPISSLQRFRPVGGYLIGTGETLEFAPNRFEALIGGRPWTISIVDVENVTLGHRHLKVVSSDGGTRTLFSNRTGALRRHLAETFDRATFKDGARFDAQDAGSGHW